jgi:hypothetical protein
MGEHGSGEFPEKTPHFYYPQPDIQKYFLNFVMKQKNPPRAGEKKRQGLESLQALDASIAPCVGNTILSVASRQRGWLAVVRPSIASGKRSTEPPSGQPITPS